MFFVFSIELYKKNEIKKHSLVFKKKRKKQTNRSESTVVLYYKTDMQAQDIRYSAVYNELL
jgi:hypothetical protein